MGLAKGIDFSSAWQRRLFYQKVFFRFGSEPSSEKRDFDSRFRRGELFRILGKTTQQKEKRAYCQRYFKLKLSFAPERTTPATRVASGIVGNPSHGDICRYGARHHRRGVLEQKRHVLFSDTCFYNHSGRRNESGASYIVQPKHC
jgi:hypothetical protein